MVLTRFVKNYRWPVVSGWFVFREKYYWQVQWLISQMNTANPQQPAVVGVWACKSDGTHTGTRLDRTPFNDLIMMSARLLTNSRASSASSCHLFRFLFQWAPEGLVVLPSRHRSDRSPEQLNELWFLLLQEGYLPAATTVLGGEWGVHSFLWSPINLVVGGALAI